MIVWIWVLIPIFGIVAGMLTIWTEHRRKMAMIEKGIYPETAREVRAGKPENTLIGGLVVFGIGLAFLITQLVGGLIDWMLLPGFILLFIGIALTVGYYLSLIHI